MYIRTRWRVVVCQRCGQPIEAVLTASPYIPVYGLGWMAKDHEDEYGHWPITRVEEAEKGA